MNIAIKRLYILLKLGTLASLAVYYHDGDPPSDNETGIHSKDSPFRISYLIPLSAGISSRFWVGAHLHDVCKVPITYAITIPHDSLPIPQTHTRAPPHRSWKFHLVPFPSLASGTKCHSCSKSVQSSSRWECDGGLVTTKHES
jgi:hypothetical protein